LVLVLSEQFIFIPLAKAEEQIMMNNFLFFKSSTECTEIAALYNCSQINLQFYAEMPSDGYSVLFCCC
jgi:hypothetical protein